MAPYKYKYMCMNIYLYICEKVHLHMRVSACNPPCLFMSPCGSCRLTNRQQFNSSRVGPPLEMPAFQLPRKGASKAMNHTGALVYMHTLFIFYICMRMCKK